MSSALAGWVVVLLLAPGLIVLIGVVVAFALRRRDEGAAYDADAPGLYHVTGVDRASGAPREKTVSAAGRANAAGLATLDGIVVTRVTRVDKP